MYKGEFHFVDCEHRQGVSNTTGKEYNFANVTLSDGLQSFVEDLNPELVPNLAGAVRGDRVNVTLICNQKKKGNEYKIANILKVAK